MDYIDIIIGILTGAGVFLIGVKLLSSNIEKLANNKIKSLFNKTANNKIINVGIGMTITALVQSSGVTTVLIVGFVNVGVMSLLQATAMIMGANIGTTITAQIAALQAFKFSEYAVFLTFVGIFLSMIIKNENIKKWGLAIAGLGLVFVGLGMMTASMEDLKKIASDLFTYINNPFLLFLIGILLTALTQSSSAITSIVISISAAGLVIGDGCNSVLFIILGTNIGSCVTAILSSFGATTNAKRAGLIHLMFNTFGSVIFFIILLCWKNFMNDTFAKWFSEAPTQIAMFHTFFNLICTLLFLPFSKLFVKISNILIKEKGKNLEESLIDERMISTPAIAISQLEKESMRMADVCMDAFTIAYEAFREKNESKIEISQKKIEEAILLNKNITDYLIKVSALSGINEEKQISCLYNNIGDIMRISEIADNFNKYTKREISEKLEFSSVVLERIEEMVNKINNLFELTKNAILTKNKSLINEVDVVENSIDDMRKELIDGHIERLNKGECRPENSSVFINLVSNLERLGDHLTYIAYTIA